MLKTPLSSLMTTQNQVGLANTAIIHSPDFIHSLCLHPSDSTMETIVTSLALYRGCGTSARRLLHHQLVLEADGAVLLVKNPRQRSQRALLAACLALGATIGKPSQMPLRRTMQILGENGLLMRLLRIRTHMMDSMKHLGRTGIAMLRAAILPPKCPISRHLAQAILVPTIDVLQRRPTITRSDSAVPRRITIRRVASMPGMLRLRLSRLPKASLSLSKTSHSVHSLLTTHTPTTMIPTGLVSTTLGRRTGGLGVRIARLDNPLKNPAMSGTRATRRTSMSLMMMSFLSPSSRKRIRL